jgi:hypothetical protein
VRSRGVPAASSGAPHPRRSQQQQSDSQFIFSSHSLRSLRSRSQLHKSTTKATSKEPNKMPYDLKNRNVLVTGGSAYVPNH